MTEPLAADAPEGPRFKFGENWQRFLSVIDERRIGEAQRSLERALHVSSLLGRSFLDVGSGSGLFSLAAARMGATPILSVDYDVQSVAATSELRRRHVVDGAQWAVERADVLDPQWVERNRGRWDIVYSWGVLHHTGDMWRAMAHAAQLVAAGGFLLVALYNDQGWRSRWWSRIKRVYNKGGRLRRAAMRWSFFGFYVVLWWVADIVRLRNPTRRYRGFERRGMSPYRDVVDWIGGYPFEVARPEIVESFYASRGFELRRSTLVGRRSGCNEFLFQRTGGVRS